MSINSWTCQNEVICLLRVSEFSDVSINSWTCQSEVICLLICGHVRVK